jgi:hypothetical protein
MTSYITEYSYGIAESLNLIAQAFGGSNNESLSKDSEIVEFFSSREVAQGQYITRIRLLNMPKGMPTYWEINLLLLLYIGIVVFLYGRTGTFIDDRKIKFVFSFRIIASLLLSWGRNFPV